jgi:transglutaminase-like putative cysteine protease
VTIYNLVLKINYRFDRPSGTGRQQFRIIPADLPGVQRLHRASVEISPPAAERYDFTDFFGTSVVEASMMGGLKKLSLDLHAIVERLRHEENMDFSAPPETLAANLASFTGLGADSPHHFQESSSRIPPVEAISAYAQKVAGHSGTARRAVQRLGEALHRDMTFDAEATEVYTPPAEAFAARRGVCQDFTQIMIGALRSLGIPAAYVAGYLRTTPPPGKKRLEGADAMHAWVRAWTGIRGGWVEYDPTNACFAGADHIVVGYGRDYGDVAPVTGMLRLDGSQEGSHSVDLVEIPAIP